MALSRDASAEAGSSRRGGATAIADPVLSIREDNEYPHGYDGDGEPAGDHGKPLRDPPVALHQPTGLAKLGIPRQLHSMVAGAGAGLVSSIATCPLDVVKTTLQAQSTARGAVGYEGVTLTVMRIYRQSGLRGFYRGLGPTIAGYLPTWGIYFTVYDFIKDRLRDIPVAHDISHVVAAMTAGGTGTILTNPLWVVKTRFMAQAILPPSAPRYNTTLGAFVSIYQNEGLRAFYKGLLPSLFGVSHVAVQFGLYEKAKAWAARDGQPLSPSAILACSAVSKMVASLATYPHEVLRTRIQVQKSRSPKPAAVPKPSPGAALSAPAGSSSSASMRSATAMADLYSPLVTGSTPPYVEEQRAAQAGRRIRRSGPVGRGHVPHQPAPISKATPAPAPAREPRKEGRWKRGGIVDVFRQIYRQDGWRGFYRGLSINLVRTVPSSAVTMLSYELIMRSLSGR